MSRKVVVVGDSKVGKTCFLIAYSSNAFPEEYVPSLFDNYSSRTGIDPYSLWDTKSDLTEAESAKLVPLVYVTLSSYEHTDVFMICFSVSDRASYNNVQSIWLQNINRYQPNALLLLIGTKTDLRQTNSDCLTTEMGHKLAKQIKASAYIEISAKKLENVRQPFELLETKFKVQKKSDKPTKERCIIN